MSRRPEQSGFTLLEILVVVTLVAGIAAFVMPALLGENPGKAQRSEADRIGRLLTLASDYSLFRGQLVAVTLTSDQITPLVFSLDEQDFIPVDEKGLRAIDLEEPLQLEWELDTTGSPDQPTLAQAALAVRNEKKQEPGEQGDQQAEVPEEDPQLFFFPSGEATGAVLLIRHPDNPETLRLKLDAMGRVSDPDAPAQDEADDESSRMDRLIRDLLAYSRVDDKVRAWMVASDKLVELQVFQEYPAVGTNDSREERFGETWNVRTRVSNGPYPDTRRVDIEVGPEAGFGEESLVFWTQSSLLGKPQAAVQAGGNAANAGSPAGAPVDGMDDGRDSE